jgi:hypothetical protein
VDPRWLIVSANVAVKASPRAANGVEPACPPAGERTSWSTSSRRSTVSDQAGELTDEEFTAAKRHLLEG